MSGFPVNEKWFFFVCKRGGERSVDVKVENDWTELKKWWEQGSI